ncbi:hypothetical protein D3C86_2125280 [compost metagenome]
MHRAHQHPVLQGGEAEVERLEQFGIGHGGSLFCNPFHKLYRPSFILQWVAISAIQRVAPVRYEGRAATLRTSF